MGFRLHYGKSRRNQGGEPGQNQSQRQDYGDGCGFVAKTNTARQ
jgi:hypothetical protein